MYMNSFSIVGYPRVIASYINTAVHIAILSLHYVNILLHAIDAITRGYPTMLIPKHKQLKYQIESQTFDVFQADVRYYIIFLAFLE